MGFQVDFSIEAKQNIAEIYHWICERSVQGADRWYQELLAAVESLEMASSVPGHVAPESEEFPIEVRHSVFKVPRGRPYRIVFQVEEGRIQVLSVRGKGMKYVEPIEH